MLVQTTSTAHEYTFYKFLAKDGDVLNLSNDINDFANRYRVNAGTDGLSNNDAGDLVFDTSASKMKVYDGSSWGEVTSTGDFKFLALTVAGTANAAVYGSATSFDLKEGSISGAAASITSAAQLIVSVNGVIQKPNSGTSQPAEGFAMADSDTIIFGSAPPSGSTVFAIQIGAATDLQVPADNTVTAAKLDLSIVQGDLIYGTGTDTWAKLAKGTAGKVLKMNSGATAPEWADDLNTQIGGATGVDFNDTVPIRFGTGNDMQIVGNANNSGSISNANGGIGISVGASPYQVTLNGWNTSGTPANNLTVVANSGSNTYADLRFDGNVKLATTNTGVSVTGGVTTTTASTFVGDVTFDNGTNAGKDITWDESDDALEFADNTKIVLGTGGDYKISFNSANAIFENDSSNTGGDVYFYQDDLYIGNVAQNETVAAFKSDGGCELYYDNTKEFETKSGGVILLGCSQKAIVTGDGQSGSQTLPFLVADIFTYTLSGNITFAAASSTEAAGQSGSIFIIQPGSGGPYTAAWGSNFKWPGGTAPTLSTAAGAKDRVDYIVESTGIIHCVATLDIK